MRTGAKHHVSAAQVDQLGRAQPGLKRDQQDRVIPTPDPRRLVGRAASMRDRTRFAICGAKLQVSDSPFCRFPSNRPGPSRLRSGARRGGNVAARRSVRVVPVLKSAGLHLRKRLRLSHDRGPPQYAALNSARETNSTFTPNRRKSPNASCKVISVWAALSG
jgi:hypothetical protein